MSEPLSAATLTGIEALKEIIERWDKNDKTDPFGKFDALADAIWAAGYRREQSGENNV